MKVQISAEELRKRKLMVATPMYEGLCHAGFTRGLVELSMLCQRYGVAMELQFLTNQSDTSRARNYICDAFLKGDATHLMFIDADIAFSGEQALQLLALQDETSPYDMLGAAYPRKAIRWDRVREASGAANVRLDHVASDLVLNVRQEQASLDRPIEVERLGIGFSMLRRETLQKMRADLTDIVFRPGADERAAFQLGATAHRFFGSGIDPRTGEYLSEDFAFCERLRSTGQTIWACPWIELGHAGNMTFQGSLIDFAKLQAARQSPKKG